MPRLRLVTSICLLACLGSTPASASVGQESMFQDDNLLVYAPAPAVAKTMDQLKAYGVDRLRISVFWAVVAPDPKSQTRPANFDATNPAAYPPGAWDRYDAIVKLAALKGLGVNFNITSPAPSWATGNPARADLDKNYTPDAKAFGEFVRAVATRYSGSFVPGVTGQAPAAPPPAQGPPILGGSGSSFRQAMTGGTPPLPRVDYWTIWNEPNQPGWLTPQWVADPRDGKGFIELAPAMYRTFVDAAFAALQETGHAKDTLLIGELAPKGAPTKVGETRALKPARFIRQLYCLDDTLQFLRGTEAEVRGCPTESPAASMRTQHPGLFAITGWSHHPYELTFAPTQRPKDPEDFTIANLNRLSDLMRRVFQRYGQAIPGGGRDVPLYLTEFGYQTTPPDPIGVSLAKQAAYLNQSEYLTARNGRVRALTQFLLVDDLPRPGVKNAVEAYGATFQSGLRTDKGKAKPALAAYKLPIFLPRRTVRKAGRSLRVWGMVRAAPNGTAARVVLERRVGRRGAFRRSRTATAQAARGYVSTKVVVRGTSSVRWAWKDARGRTVRSRSVSVGVRKR